ncbi:hypothetical protein EZS27_001497 [termite gut metagenome]|uniref:Uncharacterized protein n=1 Tax=termite gut metagenome TaxID=433724 RepID=A0A5J4SYV7_9ZZZZ
MKKIFLILMSVFLLLSCKEEENFTTITNENDISLVIKNEYEIDTEVTTKSISPNNKIRVVAFSKENYNLASKEVFSCYFISDDGENYRLEDYNKDSDFFKNLDFSDPQKDYKVIVEILEKDRFVNINQSLDSEFEKADYITGDLYSSKNSLDNRQLYAKLTHQHILVEVNFSGEKFDNQDQFQNYLNNDIDLKFHTRGNLGLTFGDITSNLLKDENGNVKTIRAIIPLDFIPNKNGNNLFSFNNIDKTKRYECTWNATGLVRGNKLNVDVSFINDKLHYDFKITSLNNININKRQEDNIDIIKFKNIDVTIDSLIPNTLENILEKYGKSFNSLTINGGELSDKDFEYFQDEKFKDISYIDLSKTTNKKIPSNTFKNLKIVDFYFPENITEIGDSAFYNCENAKINYNNINKCRIGKYAFYNCRNLEGDLNLIEEISNYFIRCIYGDYAFYNCENLTGNLFFLVNSTYQVNYIKNTFRGSGITKITAEVSAFYENTFSDCKKLKEIIFYDIMCYGPRNISENDIFSLTKGLFRNCINLEKIFVFNVKTIESEAFSGCKNIKSVEIRGNDNEEEGKISRIAKTAFEPEILKILKFSRITIVNNIDDEIIDENNDGINDDVIIDWK